MKNRILLSGAAAVAVVGLLTGCGVIDTIVGKPPAVNPTNAPTFATTDPVPEFVPDGTAAENLPFFNYTNLAYATGADPINGQNAVNTLVNAGFDKAAMQVSFDTSAKGLAADNIFVSVLMGDQCLMGQYVVEDRSYVGAVEPALGPNKSVCNPSATRPIDW
ncbi:DUF6993 domain-containing protein [Lysinibacter cavernae]|uniref:DUF6993 domain-containing protein n=1 Tax=Lysinibacter cavernae TaxID=1640652 RepID=A0A7X5TTW9_9MICO|nr:hypothetical protein [Lysinibacter cavernae]NIH53047.1 hypothetical protein [Lysinibacter cavernae]